MALTPEEMESMIEETAPPPVQQSRPPFAPTQPSRLEEQIPGPSERPPGWYPAPRENFGVIDSALSQADTLGGIVGAAFATSPYARGIFGLVKTAPQIARAIPPALQTARTVAASAIGAGAGASLGSFVGDQAQRLRGQDVPIVPSIAKAAVTGIENAALDAGGNFVFNLAGKTYKIAKGAIAQRLGKTPVSPDEAKVAVQQMLEEGGGSLTKYQVTEKGMDALAEAPARSLPGGTSVFKTLENANTKALTEARNKILDDIAPQQYDALASGSSIKEVIEKGDEALSAQFAPLYKAIDDEGKGVLVDFSKIKSEAFESLQQAKKLSERDKASDFLGSQIAAALEETSNIAADLTFSEAHQLKSRLMRAKRAASIPGSPDSAIEAHLAKVITGLDEAMEASARNLNSDLYTKYRAVSDSYRESVTSLYPETLKRIFKTGDAAMIGDQIFKAGNVQTILDARKAVKEAAKLDPKLDATKLLKDLERGYAESSLGVVGNTVDITNLRALGKKLKDNQQFARTYATALPKQTRDNMQVLLNAAEMINKKPGNALSLFFASEQIGAARAVAGLVAGSVAAGAAGGVQYATDNPILAAAAATGVLLSPRILAKIATNREAVRHLIDAERWAQKISTAGGKAAQLAGAAESLSDPQNMSYAQRMARDLSNAYSKAGITEEDLKARQQPLSPGEEQELINGF